MSKGFAFKQNLHLCSVSNLRIVLVFQLRIFKVGFSGPGFRETGPWMVAISVCLIFQETSGSASVQSGSLSKRRKVRAHAHYVLSLIFNSFMR